MIKLSIEKVKSLSNRVVTSKAVIDAETDLSNYDFDKINKEPKTSAELYDYFNSQFGCLINYFKKVIGEIPFALSNEIRAMYGHLVDYGLDNRHKKVNLEKAYGHFRRLNLDALKLLCDEYDKFFAKFLKRHIKYSYKKVAPDFIRDFAESFFNARSNYMQAQSNEELGTNDKINIYESYYKALDSFVKLRIEYAKYYKKVRLAKSVVIGAKCASVFVSLFCSIVTLITLF